MKTWLLIALLLTGCMKDADGKHIGGLEVGPVVKRYLNDTDPGAAQPYVYPALWLLGDLKRQMQLSGNKWGERDYINQDGIKIHAQSNMWGQADIDEIWIDMPVVIGNRPPVPIRIVAFAIYFKTHKVYYPTESYDSLLSREVHYYVGEPYNTTGAGLNLYSLDTGSIAHDIYRTTYYYSTSPPLIKSEDYTGPTTRTDMSSSTLGGSNKWVEMFEGYYDDGVDIYNFDVLGTASASNYGLYMLPNTSFEADEDYTYADGYVGKAAAVLSAEQDFDLVISDEVQATFATQHNTISRTREQFHADQVDTFIPGFYAIGAMNRRHAATVPTNGKEPFGESLDADFGGYTLVFTLSNGDKVSYDFDFTFSFTSEYPNSQMTQSTKVVMFDPTIGVVNEYELPQASTPFFTSIVNGSVVSEPRQNREVTADPTNTYDVFENYRNANYIIQ